MIETLNQFGIVTLNVELSKMSSYRIGGIAEMVIEPQSIEQLVNCINYLNSAQLNYKVIGYGSNLLFSDDPYNGIIVKIHKYLQKIEIRDDCVYAEAGVGLIRLAHFCVANGWGGLEFASGIPGSLGGALFMNAGAYQRSMYDVVNRVLVYQNNELKWIDRDHIKVDYRYSNFMDDPTSIICAAELNLHKCDKETAQKMMKDRLERRLNSQPLEYPSCGSVFRNPYPDLAWQLIENVGLRGYRIGDAQISLKHANFIVNLGHAKASDVRALIELVEKEVYEQMHIELKREVEFFNFK